MSCSFWYQPFVAVSGIPGGVVPIFDDVVLSRERKIYPNTSIDENRIEFDFQADRIEYVDLRQTNLSSEMKFVRGGGYESYNSKEVKKEHKEETTAEE